MQVTRYHSLDELAPLADDWDRLARGVPFRSWAWMSSWWRHYGLSPSGGRGQTLFALVVRDPQGAPVGIAPWYCRTSVSQGRVLRFLGVEETCGDYLSVLCQPGREEAFAAALAQWLFEAGRGPQTGPAPADSNAWDLLELTAVDAEDRAVCCLADRLAAAGHTVHRRSGPRCWRIELPDTWDAYLAMLSKSHRKQLRRMERDLLATGRVAVQRVQRQAELDRVLPILVDLHQRRRQALGQPGCFASPRYAAFQHDVMPRLLETGQLDLSWVELDGRPLAAEYHLAAGGVVYAYQSGVDPRTMKHSPGQLSNMIAIRRALEQGHRAFDFLRGDEPYKPHFRAVPRPTVEFRIAGARHTARLRHGLWLVGSNVKHWLKSSPAVASIGP